MKGIYQLGLYADHNGFSCAVIKNELAKKYLVTQTYNNMCSNNLILETVKEIYERYYFKTIYMNSLSSLEKTLKDNTAYSVKKVSIEDIPNLIYEISSLLNDKLLIVNESLLETFKHDMNLFSMDTVSHRIYALMLLLSKEDYDYTWLKNL